MALNRLLTLLSTAGVEPQLAALGRWTETSDPMSWDAEPDYGAFVDDEGRVVGGSAPARAFLDSDDPTRMELASETARRVAPATVVFVDWGRQQLSWPEIFGLWAVWEEQEMIADCGSVGVPWELSRRWVSPGWIAFWGDFDGSPLSTVVRKTAEVPSFLARARRLRERETGEASGEEPLPMLPFTLADLGDPGRSWPQGAV